MSKTMNMGGELEYETVCPFCGGVSYRFDIETIGKFVNTPIKTECPHCSIPHVFSDENTKLIKHRNRQE